MAIALPKNFSLGSSNVQAFPKVQYDKIKEIIDALNNLTDGSISTTDLTLTGDLSVGDDADVVGDLTAGTFVSDAGVTATTTLNYGTLLTEGLTTGITAFATGGQASATALTKSVNNVTTVATAGDSVKLPAAATGLTVTVKNSGAAALDIFPATDDSIDALAANLAVRIQPGSVATFRAISAVVWESSVDASFTLNAPTTASGQLELKAANSAGNTVTTITNASQAAARTYTIPDAGASAEFVMNAGTQSIAGLKTFTDPITQNDTSNQIVLGVTNTTTISATAPSASRVVTIPDPGGAASFVMTEGTQTINGAKTLGGTLTAAGIVQAPVFVPDATPYTVLAADSGKMHIILEQTSNITLNLPVIAAGLSYKFIMGGVATEAQNWVIVATTPSFWNGGIAWTDLNDAESNLAVVYGDGSSNLTLTVVTPAAGTCIEVYSNGTEWFVHGTVISDTTPAFT